MPAHNLIQLVSAVVKGYCDIHGTDSIECGAVREAGTILIGGLALVGIASVLSKR